MRGLTHAERAVVTALNAHITRNEEVSLTELAQECHVAKSTVVKTLQRLGYQGFEEFRYNYRLSRVAQPKSTTQKLMKRPPRWGGRDSRRRVEGECLQPSPLRSAGAIVRCVCELWACCGVLVHAFKRSETRSTYLEQLDRKSRGLCCLAGRELGYSGSR